MKRFLDFIEWPTAAGLLLLIGMTAQAQEEEVIEVRPPAPAIEQPAVAPSYWIGILGGEVSPALRSHLGLEGAGVLVREVVPGSPAAEGGLKKHDVLLTANGQPVTDMGALAKIVREQGGKADSKIVLDLLRTGAHMQLTLVPAERPATPQPEAPLRAQPDAAAAEGFFGDALAFGGDGQPFRFRLFGPGIAFGGANVDIKAPGNTSVSVQTQNGKTRVEVTQNGKTWEVDADDPEALEQLPPEVRPMVEDLLQGQGQGVDINVDVQDIVPQMEGIFERFGERRAERVDNRLRRRIELMERQVEELRKRLGMPAGAEAAAAAEADLGEAPAFQPPPAPAAEIELPAEEQKEK